jgi:hypothetical protein
VYFPGTGVCSITDRMSDGAAIEIASVGSEGIVGLNALTGETLPGRQTFVQVGDGTAQWMPLGVFEREIGRNDALRGLADRFCQNFLESMMQLVVCNRLHTLTQRCSRWLLTTHDRLGRVRFEMHPSGLARVFGVSPADLAGVTGRFEQLGLASFEERSITIFDAFGLERLTCPCYRALKRAYEWQPASVVADTPPGDAADESARQPLPARILQMPAAGPACCALCGTAVNLPHKSETECLIALDAEAARLCEQLRMLRRRRIAVVERRLSMYRSFLRNSSHWRQSH